MILTALKEFGDAEGLTRDLDFEYRDVSWIIELMPNGRVAGITDVRVADPRGVPRPQPMRVPASGQRAGKAPTPWFLCDNSRFVLGAEIAEDGSIEPLPERLAAFRALIDEAAANAHDEGLNAVAHFLRDRDPNTGRPKWLPEDLAAGDWLTFRLVGDAGLVSNRPAVERWWRDRCVEVAQPTAQCLITGQPCVPAGKHDPIKGIVPGPGTAIVTYNSSAFESYGLERNENAPIGRVAARAYVRVLNRLLDASPPDPRDASRTLPSRRVRLGSDSVAVFWADPGGDAFADLFAELFDRPNPEVVGRLLSAPRSGAVPVIPEQARFFALTLSGSQGRAAIRDWFVDSVVALAERVRRYFEDLDLAFAFENAPRPSLHALLRSVVLRGEAGNVPANLAGDVFRAILRDQPLPSTLLSAALRRIRAEGPLSLDRNRRIDWYRSHSRMQILKAVLERLRRHRRRELPEVKAMLDEKSRNVAYLLGRLFAVLERLQGLSQGDVNATIGDRFYGAASATPGVAFSQLVRLSKHHLSKLRRDRPGAAVNLDKLIGSIYEALPAQGFPTVLAMEDQGLFSIGYYHQRQAFFRRREDELPTN